MFSSDLILGSHQTQTITFHALNYSREKLFSLTHIFSVADAIDMRLRQSGRPFRIIHIDCREFASIGVFALTFVIYRV